MAMKNAGPRGTVLPKWFHIREKYAHSNHERIPEHVVHACVYGTDEFLQAYQGNHELTKANCLCDAKCKTSGFFPVSTVAGNKGSFDTARDVGNLSTKFSTRQGNYDLVGNNVPRFFTPDAIKLRGVIHAVEPNPGCEFRQAPSSCDLYGDCVSLPTKWMHMLMGVISEVLAAGFRGRR